jgi:hypothetical protein
MLYGLLADLIVIVHLALIAFVAVGGFLAWRWPRLLWLHVPAITYALVIVTVGFDCPLTPLEKYLRHVAGQAGYADGFVDHYLTGVLYPDRLLGLARALVAAAVVASYAGLLLQHRRWPGAGLRHGTRRRAARR